MSEPHDHPHEHPHPTLPDHEEHLTYWRAMEVAVRELLIEKGIVTADEVRRQVEDMDGRNAGMGAKMVARAWLDPAYKQRMFDDGNAAAEEVGLDHGAYKLVVVENAPSVHNVIVCTLCSCYPRWLLGLPPDWYKSRNYRSRVVCEPRAVLREFGLEAARWRNACACTIRPRTCAIWSCRCDPLVPMDGARSDSRRSRRATR